MEAAIKTEEKDVLILAIESSCDETAAAVVKNGRTVLSNVISSQIALHTLYGGVVPEIASRKHIEKINQVIEEALQEADVTLEKIDAIAVTYGPGLVGALLVGVSAAKAISFSTGIPLVGVHHIEGHISANYLSHKSLEPPFVCLMVSGGHTAILEIDDYISQKMIGSTIDDAVGEAFDKVARVLGLPYPGGVEVDRLAKDGENNIEFIKHKILPDNYNFSFSGIKTAVINYLNTKKQKGIEVKKEDVCASFQTLVVEELCSKTIKACLEKGFKKLVVAGGVGANSFLKKRLSEECEKHSIQLFHPELKLCTDNAGMIASAGYFYIRKGKGLSDLNLTAKPVVGLN
ncbi:MAG: tRNA (adenosine(37)-N6)-threonylcarbamoyltransferase complex transferase subunit TsaD [Clostridia bacterium]|nr:tRNA (adenosine(37)-N6)-threonylcarbamoyltransferase complex transferase subunit TsaD [Clostridia bacterium]